MAGDDKKIKDPHKPPPRPWERGRHKDHVVFNMALQIVENKDGWVFSSVGFESSLDGLLAGGLSSGGNRQIAFALLAEACRREVFLDVLIHLSEHRDILVRYAAGGSEASKIEEDLIRQAEAVMTRTIRKMMRPTVQGVLEMMLSSLTVGHGEEG